MANFSQYLLSLFLAAFTSFSSAQTQTSDSKNNTLLKDVTLIDGNGGPAQQHMDVLIRDGRIEEIGKGLQSKDAVVVNLAGKTVMPSLMSAHVHVGALKGTTTVPANYTRENVLSQLKKYEDYGVSAVLSMGSDRPLIFETGLVDSSGRGFLPGARMYSAGFGFGVPQGAPPVELAMDRVYRPASPEQVIVQMDSLAALKPAMVKIWVDDFAGKFKKMDPAIYKAVISEAHKHNLRVTSHVYYLSDARKLVADGLDVIGHSVRDSVITDDLVQLMKRNNVVYIPTLSLDEFSFIYARKPEWINDPFFKASLEPGVYEMITSEKYQSDLMNSPAYKRNMAGFDIALKNLKKIFDAGILVALGTDSGAMPLRAQGFSEHLELELMVQAGLTPSQAIVVATKNAAQVLKSDQHYGILKKGNYADLIVLDANPLENIKNTRKINRVYKAGKEVSKGPVLK